MKKKCLLLLLLPLFYYTTLTAQSFAINTDGSAANASALLDVKSTAKGILIPRMTKTERNSIAGPATGLMIFQTGPDSIGFHYYNGSSWSWVSSSTNGGDWKLTGNSGTDTANNFIGTTDNMALRFKINNQQAGLISNNNNLIGLGAGKSLGTSTGITAMGVGALGLNKNRNGLVAFGDSALYNNSTGSPLPLQSTQNSAFGFKALLNNTTGGANTGSGYQSLYSNTIGSNNSAFGANALSFNTTGTQNTATGSYALYRNITGTDNNAIGFHALVNSTAGSFNIAIGTGTLLANDTGSYNTAIGYYAAYYNTRDYNTAVGYNALMGNAGAHNTVVGAYAIPANSGYYCTALGDSANVFGSINATAIGAKSFANCTNCLVLGSINGVNGATSNVNVGIGTTSPDALLHVQRGAVLFDSTIGVTPVSGAGTRMMWIPAKAAFRAGSVNGTSWDNSNIGQNSVAFGENTFASGPGSTAFGFGTAATGIYSTAMGYMTGAWGFRSTAMGFNTFALGDYSTSMGEQTIASGKSSSCTGAFIKSKSYAGFATGIYNDSTNAANATAINSLNRVFQVGNGTADNARSNAITVLQNGNAGIGVLIPARMLSVGTDIAVDENNTNNGTLSSSLHFGASNSGEGIASNRFSGNLWGLDFYTNSVNRLSISNGGNVGIGTTAPAAKLDVNGTTTTNGLQVSNGNVFTKMQSGSVTVGPSGTSQLTYTITFPVAFTSATPRVFATARNEPSTSYNDAFSVSIRSVSATAVILNIQRTDSNGSWAQQLRVDWFAVE